MSLVFIIPGTTGLTEFNGMGFAIDSLPNDSSCIILSQCLYLFKHFSFFSNYQF